MYIFNELFIDTHDKNDFSIPIPTEKKWHFGFDCEMWLKKSDMYLNLMQFLW